MRYLTPVILTLGWNPQGFILVLDFPFAAALDSHEALRKNDLYHIDITPATTPAADGKNSRNFNAYP